MSGDINSLGHQLNRFSERNRHFRDFTLYSLISTLKEVIACFPVYRTYVTDGRRRSASTIGGTSRERCSRAKRRTPAVDAAGVRLRRAAAAQADAGRRRREECEERARFIGKFQQITSPVAAKGIEDTALYIYNRLLSLNEVGAEPTRFGLEPAARARVDGRARSGSGRARCRRPRRTTPSAARTCARGSTCCRRCPARGSGAVDAVARDEPPIQDRDQRRARARRRTRNISSTRRSSARGRSSATRPTTRPSASGCART